MATNQSASSPPASSRRTWSEMPRSARTLKLAELGLSFNPGSIIRNYRTRSISPEHSLTPPSSSTMWAGCSEPNLILSAVRRSCPVWQRDIKQLAQCPNVNVKMGGIGMTSFGFEFHERDVPPSSEDLATAWRHYVQPCIEASGVNRCMFESNFHRISSPTVTPNCGTRSSVSLPAPR